MVARDHLSAAEFGAVPTPREVNDAADVIGEDVAWEMTGNRGFSEASAEQLRAIVDAAKRARGGA